MVKVEAFPPALRSQSVGEAGEPELAAAQPTSNTLLGLPRVIRFSVEHKASWGLLFAVALGFAVRFL